MKILALLTPAEGASPGDFGPYFVAEEKAVWALYKAGTLRELYFQPEPVAVSLVFEGATKAEVRAAIDGFPMVKAGLLDIQLVALGPWVPLEALFEPAHRG